MRRTPLLITTVSTAIAGVGLLAPPAVAGAEVPPPAVPPASACGTPPARDLRAEADRAVVVVDRTRAAGVAAGTRPAAAATATPAVRTVRLTSPRAARDLAARLDALPGVAAGISRLRCIAQPAAGRNGGGPRDAGTVPAGIMLARASSAAMLAGEPRGGEQWGVRTIGAEAAWRQSRGAGVVIAVIDTGVDARHPDLRGRVLPQINLVRDGLTGDPQGHGTHVAGIIAASLNRDGVAGVANRARILPVRVLDRDGVGDDALLVAGIAAAVRAGADVINMSLGGPDTNPALRAAIASAVAAGVTVVAAGGNGKQDGNLVEYPAAYPGVLGVGAIDAAGRWWPHSTTGRQIDLAAPGVRVLSTVPGNGYRYADGTSMATPFVAAAAGLVRSANPHLSKLAVDRILTATAQDDAGDGRDTRTGYGVVRADRAVARAVALRPAAAQR